MRIRMGVGIVGGLAALMLACHATEPKDLERLRDPDEATANEAIAMIASRGEAALPALVKLKDDPDPRVRRRAKNAIGRITGQWGSDGRVAWKRSVAEAVASATGKDRPLLVLHLFGSFDQELC